MEIPAALFVARILLFIAGSASAAEPTPIMPASSFPVFFPGLVVLLY
jgi:hypothetical protein